MESLLAQEYSGTTESFSLFKQCSNIISLVSPLQTCVEMTEYCVYQKVIETIGCCHTRREVVMSNEIVIGQYSSSLIFTK
jgi:hypothetical protein